MADPNVPHPEPAAGRGRVEGWAGARPTPDVLRHGRAAPRLSMRLVGERDFRASEAMRRVEWQTPTSLIPSGRGTRSCRGMGPVHGRGRACFDTGALRPAQHEARWSGGSQRPSSRAGRGTRSCRGMGRCTAEAVRASTRARCARLSMRLGEQDSHSSEAMRGVEWRTPTSLIPSRPRDAVVSRDGPAHGRGRACFDTGALRPAQHEAGGGTRFSRK